MRKRTALIFKNITERKLLKRLKILCKKCDFESPRQYKLHSFRRHFASICANHHVAYRKALTWLGHSSSEMLELYYYHLHDDDSQKAMLTRANSGIIGGRFSGKNLAFEGNGAVKNRENATSA